MRQRTLSTTYSFEGKGLHTGVRSSIVIRPAASDTGIVFRRTDAGGALVAARAENVSSTARSTTLSAGGVEVNTVEHLMSVLTGLGVDNALIDIDNVEVPILDGSASPYLAAMAGDSLVEQDTERKYLEISEPVEVKDEKSGSYVRIEPADDFSYEVTVDFGSEILGVQKARWEASVDYVTQIGVCRTFVFFHEIEFLFANNLIKGGDVDNAIIIAEHPVDAARIERLSALFGRRDITVRGTDGRGYLSNVDLHFPDECGRHKLLDLIGDMRLAGGFLKARVTAYKPGHGINTTAAKALSAALKR